MVVQTIKTMLESGIDESTIKATLYDAGLSDAEIAQSLAEAKGVKPGQSSQQQFVAQSQPQPAEVFHEQVASKTAEKVKDHLDTAFEEHEIGTAMMHSSLEEHGAKLGEVHKDISELHEKVDNISEQLPKAVKFDTTSIDSRLNTFEKNLGEIKAATTALQGLLQKILDANREILLKMEKEKKKKE